MADSVSITANVESGKPIVGGVLDAPTITVNVVSGVSITGSVVAGAKGDPGEGVPAGGTTDQVLAKASNADFDTHWVTGGGGGGAVDSVNGQTGVVVLDADDISDTTTANKFVTSAEKTKLSNLSGTNTGDQDLSSYATTASVTAGLSGKANTSHTHAESDVTGLTTDLAGKEPTITAGTSSQYYRGDKTMQTLNQDAVPDGTTNKAYTATEKTKLSGIATAATANDTDANLKNRANHTGTQTASTISDFNTAADARITAANKKTDSMSTNKLLGRGTAGTGAIEEITLGTNLSLSGTTLNATGGGGTLNITANGTLYSGMSGLDIEPGSYITLSHSETPTGTAQISISAAPEATGTSYDNSGSSLAGGSVQLAIDELDLKAVSQNSVASPATFTSDQNDLDGTETVFRVAGNTDNRKITSITLGTAGRRIYIENVGATDIILSHDDGSSGTAANRFDFGGADVIIEPRESRTLLYDNTLQRWVKAGYDYDLTNVRRSPMYFWDYHLAGVATANFPNAAVASGTMAFVNSLDEHPGYMTITSSTTTNSGAQSFLFGSQASMNFQGGEVYECIWQPKVASNTATTTRLGFLDTITSTDAVDGAYFEVPAGSFAVVGKTSNNSTRTTSATIATIAVNTWYRFRINVNRNASSVTFSIYDANGALLGSQTNSANIPTAAGREFGAGFISTNSGTVATLLSWLDFQSVQLGGTKPLLR